MKINFFSPLPPLHTEVANHTAIVVPELAKLAEVVVWTDQKSWLPVRGAEVRRFDADRSLSATDGSSVTFYNIGNNPHFHGGIYEFSRRFPGVLILHDTNLQNLYAGLAGRTPETAVEYIDLMRRHHGADAETTARRLLRGDADVLQVMAAYPLTGAVIESAQGIIVHNEAESTAMRRAGRMPVWHVPLAFDPAQLPRLRVHRPRPPYRLIVFGHIGPNRRIRQVLQVLSMSSVRSNFALDIFGHVSDSESVDADIRSLGLDGQVRRHGFVSAQSLDRALRSADLALNLRMPSMGEASASQLRIWANAIPSIVTRTGWYASLPEDTVAFVDPCSEAEDLETHLVAFARDPTPYVHRGRRGRERLRTVHSSQAYAEEVVQIAATIGNKTSIMTGNSDCLTECATGECVRPSIASHVDVFVPGEVSGWARIPAETETRLVVWLIIDGMPEAMAEASSFRQDLLQVGYGDGCYGFVLHASAERMAAARSLAVIARSGDTEIILHELGSRPSAKQPLPKFRSNQAREMSSTSMSLTCCTTR